MGLKELSTVPSLQLAGPGFKLRSVWVSFHSTITPPQELALTQPKMWILSERLGQQPWPWGVNRPVDYLHEMWWEGNMALK